MKKKVSLKQIEANRRNALRSTGPRTQEGKAIAAQNAIKHGLSAKDFVIDIRSLEDPQAFDDLRNALLQYYRPVGIVEEYLVERIAVCMWRLRRGCRAEREAVTRQVEMRESATPAAVPCLPATPIEPTHNLEYCNSYVPYTTYAAKVGQLEAANRELVKAQTSQSEILPQGNDMRAILRYETTIHRQLYKAFDQLERLQRTRTGEPIPPSINLTLSAD